MKTKNLFNLKLIHKLLLSYFLFIIIPLAAFSTLSYKEIARIVENNTTFSAKQAYEQACSFLSYKLNKISDISRILSSDNTLATILQKNATTYDIYDQIGDMNYLEQYTSHFEDNTDISKIRLYVNNKFIYSRENRTFFDLTLAKNSKWYHLFKQNDKNNFWCPSIYLKDNPKIDYNILSIISVIKNPNDFRENVGLLRVDFPIEIVEDIIKKANIVDSGVTYIQNSQGIIIDSSNNSLTKKYKIDFAKVKALSSKSNSFKPLVIGNENCLIASSLLNNTDWYIVTIIPYHSVLSKINTIRNYLLFLLIIICTVAFSSAFYFSNLLNRRFSKLINSMRNVQANNLGTLIEDSSNDEIGELIDNYNYMITKIAVLVDEEYKLGKEVKNAELKALQSQINPHFLYNSLDMINWMSYKNMTKDISLAVKRLASFYKLSLSKGKETISIRDEITHVSLYVQIQNMRYSNRISLNVDIEESIYEYSILKITLQPLVENSILHGILGKGDVCGKILISCKLQDNEILLSVQDDGIGIPENKISTILSGELGSKFGSSYGIKNIHQRIKLFYGEKYGLSFKSQYGKGTTVEIKIPAIKQDLE